MAQNGTGDFAVSCYFVVNSCRFSSRAFYLSRNRRRPQGSAAKVFSYVLANVLGAIPVPCPDVPKANQSVMTRMPFT
jgi:hypothetical protein